MPAWLSELLDRNYAADTGYNRIQRMMWARQFYAIRKLPDAHR